MTNTRWHEKVELLISKVSRAAYQGIIVAVTGIIIATLAVCFYQRGEISIVGIIYAQQTSVALWVLDLFPLLFGFWGQYASALVGGQIQAPGSGTEDLEQKLVYATHHDVKADLQSPALFYESIGQGLLSAKQHHRLLSLLLFEITNFKEVSATLGRTSVDLLISHFCKRLQELDLRAGCVAKMDEGSFSVFIADAVDKNEMVLFAKQIQKVFEPAFAIEQLSFSTHAEIGIVPLSEQRLSFSAQFKMGIVHSSEQGEDVHSLMQKAGIALHMAIISDAGYAVYKPSFDQHSPRHLQLTGELRHAIARKELKLIYQPQVSIQAGVLLGAEALIRWHHPKYGVIFPDELMPLAECADMSKALMLWMLKEAFQHCAQWRKQGKDLTIAVNLSVKQLHDPALADLIADVAVSTGIQPAWIILEITEDAIMTDPELAVEIIERLTKKGYRFAIDGFGAGCCALTYLKKMPLSELKIEPAYVRDILTSENDDALVNAMINMAHDLGFQVSAAGVESEGILRKLRSYGCDIAQGHYVSQPFSMTDFEQWMKKSRWQVNGLAL